MSKTTIYAGYVTWEQRTGLVDSKVLSSNLFRAILEDSSAEFGRRVLDSKMLSLTDVPLDYEIGGEVIARHLQAEAGVTHFEVRNGFYYDDMEGKVRRVTEIGDLGKTAVRGVKKQLLNAFRKGLLKHLQGAI